MRRRLRHWASASSSSSSSKPISEADRNVVLAHVATMN
ncbi:hypothetical protein PF003_g20342 [Phytophthora fragariae]|nr:hypothetical protein PF003_g20342 [Phytophthora fragariae]